MSDPFVELPKFGYSKIVTRESGSRQVIEYR